MGREHRWTWKNLSAYMDGELPASEAARVEKHLRECSRCQQELDSLCRLTDLLRQVPTKAVPRPFFISEEMATERRGLRARSWVYGTLRTVSVLATLLLVFVIGGDLLFFGRVALLPGLGRPGMAPVSEELMMAEQPMVTVVVEQAIEPEVPVSKAKGTMDTPAPSSGMVARGQEATIGERSPAATPSPMALAAAPNQADSGKEGEGMLTTTAPPAAEAPASPPVTAKSVITLTAQPAEGALALVQPTEPSPALPVPFEEEHSPRPDLALDRLRSIEIILLGVVVVFITATLLLRRTMRRL